MTAATTRELKQLRSDLNVLLGMSQKMRSSRPVSLATTKIEEARMHIGNTLFEIEGAFVYTQSMNASNSVIEPYHIDEDIKEMSIVAGWNEGTMTQDTKIMRIELERVLRREKVLIEGDFLNDDEFPFAFLYMTQSIVKVREAINWFGAELGRIKETEI